ncbi:FAD-dependent oxidoreductase [candidate division WOR-3 bacterium]|nr:FAD-dependent oxidoreductase [candidate division WOR-3 bacterium]
MLYDLIILGAGPAGITAAIYAARKKMNFLIISKDLGGQTMLSSDIENYTGYQFITGIDLVEKFREHLLQFDIELREYEEVRLVEKSDDVIKIKTTKDEYQTKTVILATGRTPRRLNVEGEDKFQGRGITYCATCDAPLFAGRDVAVIGGGNSALDAVLQLIKIASKIYLLNASPQLRADAVMIEKAKNSSKVIIYNKTKIEKIDGDQFVDNITITKEGRTFALPVGGIFVEIGSTPVADYIKEVKKNSMEEIVVDCRCRTSVSGIFAAGDVTDVYAKQIIVACGEGAKAALAAFEYLTKRR